MKFIIIIIIIIIITAGNFNPKHWLQNYQYPVCVYMHI
jgi:hypothetical protein